MLNKHISNEKIIEISVITIVQIIFAVLLTLYVNYRIAEVQKNLTVELNSKQKMEETSSQFLTLSHERLFLMNRLIGFYKVPSNNADKEKFRNEYLDAVKSWNTNRGILESNLKLYFGDENLSFYQDKVDKGFRQTHEKFKTIFQNNENKTNDNKTFSNNFKRELSELAAEIHVLTQSIYELNKNMQTKIGTAVK